MKNYISTFFDNLIDSYAGLELNSRINSLKVKLALPCCSVIANNQSHVR